MNAIYGTDVHIEVPVHDTEVTDRAGDVVENVFPGIELDHEPGQLVGKAHELEHSSERLHEQAIFDTARREFVGRRDDDGFSFVLKKQATFKGVVNFSVGSPDEFGDIGMYVTVRDPPIDEVIDYIASPTEEGRLVDPNDH